MRSKVKHLIMKYKREVLNDNFDKEKVFVHILSQSDFKYFHIKEIAEILELPKDIRNKVKELKNVPSYEIIEALKDE